MPNPLMSNSQYSPMCESSMMMFIATNHACTRPFWYLCRFGLIYLGDGCYLMLIMNRRRLYGVISMYFAKIYIRRACVLVDFIKTIFKNKYGKENWRGYALVR